MRWRLFNLKIATRAYLGFAVLALGAVANVVVSTRAATDAELGLIRFRATVAHSSEVQNLRADAVELQRNVQLYTSTGHTAVIQRTAEQLDKLKSALGTLADSALEGKEQAVVARLMKYVPAYQRGVTFAVEERTLRDQLVQQELPQLAARVVAFTSEGHLTPSGDLAQALSAVQRDIYQYLTNPDYSLLIHAEAAVVQLRQSSAGEGEEWRAGLELLEAYQMTFRKVVQATRGYLFLVNVVLAGQTTEFSFDVRQLDLLARQRVAEISDDVRASSQRSHRFAIYFSVAALLASIWLTVAFRNGVAVPLRQIAETLKRLGKGERGVSIPAVERWDEIGTMARAANVFRKKNEQTATLLSETQQLATSLTEHKARLEQSNDELEQFVRTASHDLKAPLVTSSGFLGMVRELLTDGQTEMALKKLQKVERAHRRMDQLLDDLLELSRVGRTDLQREKLDVGSLVRETIEDFKLRFPDAHFSLETLEPVVANESRVLQVFENLIGNALKYGGAGLNLKIGDASDEEHIRYYVLDSGPGIAPEQHERVFGLFQRLSSKTEGTGIGLAIVARVMIAHGGRVWVESKGDGNGSKFFLEFPREPIAGRQAA